MCSNAGQSRRPKVHVTTIRLLRIVVAVVTVWSAVLPTTAALPLEEFYPFDLQNDNKTEVTDDGGSGSIQLDAGFPFFNKTHNSIYVSTIKHTENIITENLSSFAGSLHRGYNGLIIKTHASLSFYKQCICLYMWSYC